MQMAGNLKIALSEKIALLLHLHVDFPCSLCLRGDKNAALTSPSLAMAGEPGKRHDVCAH